MLYDAGTADSPAFATAAAVERRGTSPADLSQWEIVQFLNASVPWPYPADGALTHYREIAFPAIERGDEWHWTLRLRTAPEPIIGAISLSRDKAINRGFWLAPERQGQGLMTEAVIAATDYWFDVLGFPMLRVSKGRREYRIPRNFGKDRDANSRGGRTRLCFGAAIDGGLGNYGRRMA